MANPMMSVDDVAKILAYSKSHAYKVIGRLNEELEKKGFLTRPGMVPGSTFLSGQG